MFQLESTQTPFQFAIYTAYQCTPIKVIVQLQHTKVCTIQASVHAWCISALIPFSVICACQVVYTSLLPLQFPVICETESTISCEDILPAPVTIETRAKCVP